MPIRIHNHNLDLRWLRKIKKGEKTIEGRLFRGRFKNINEGDVIIWNRTLGTIVKRVKVYKSFRQLLEQENIDRILPGVDDVEEGLNVYRKYYSEHDEENLGVVAFELIVAE